MADIDIVHKKRTSVWLWIVLAIIALAVIFLLLAMAGEPGPVTRLMERAGHLAAGGAPVTPVLS